jgi:hypothetical protein
MDMNMQFLLNHHEHFVESRLRSSRQYSYGNGSPVAGIIAALAAGIRRGAATIERWARGGDADVVDYRLPRMDSVR